MEEKREEGRKKKSLKTSHPWYSGRGWKEILQIESFNRVSLDRNLWGRRQVGSSPMLVHSTYQTADDRSEEFKVIFFLETYGTFKGGKGRVEWLFLLHSFL